MKVRKLPCRLKVKSGRGTVDRKKKGQPAEIRRTEEKEKTRGRAHPRRTISVERGQVGDM